MRVIHWSDHSVGDNVVDAVYEVASLDELPPLPEGSYRTPDEKWVEVSDYDGTAYPPEAVTVGWSVFPANPGINDGPIVLRLPITPVEGGRQKAVD